jgi:hypothetical protein
MTSRVTVALKTLTNGETMTPVLNISDAEGYIVEESERRPVTGLFFAIGLLIVTGMAFWIRAAYVEAVVTDPKPLDPLDSDDEYDDD